MGNNPSSHRNNSGPAPQSPISTHHHATINQNYPSSRKEPRRRESIQALSGPKATVAPPSASLESATAHSSSQSRATPSHARHRSQTTATPHLDSPDAMGNSHSQEKARTSTPPQRPSPVTLPVDVPASSEAHGKFAPSPIDPDAGFDEQYQLPPSNFSRPPRLPLPIEEEVHTPGSPIISPADVSEAVEPVDTNGALPRRQSVLSSTTVDDDEEEAGDDFPGSDTIGPKVPTIIEWKGKGEKVYVTGTFAGWDRKYRLHKSGPSKDKDCLSASLQIPPGTHHIKFIVDGEMRVADHLPTAVDYTNILVNYLEVSPDDVPPQEKPSIPTELPPQQQQPKEPVIPKDLHPPLVLPPVYDQDAVNAAPHPAPSPVNVPKAHHHPIPKEPPKTYHSEVPRFLRDLDAAEDDPRFHRASAALQTQPIPPSLPLMLSKSILNGNTPVKDDASVLIMPNHTVLNHLATSSIKDNVLATSGTTRYKRKFLTTIMYKPTSDHGD